MAYDANGEYVPDADMAGMYDNSSQPTADPYAQQVPMGEQAAATPAFDVTAFMQGVGTVDTSLGSYGGISTPQFGTPTVMDGNPGATAGLGGNWLTDGFSKALGWFEGQKDQTKGAMVTLAGSFIKGLFSYGDEQRKLKSSEKIADASMLNATTLAEKTDKQFANASSIGNTNFGAKPAGGLIYSNKLAQRQTRAGYGG